MPGIAVTLTRRPDAALEARAAELAEELGVPLVDRRGRSVARLRQEEGLGGAVVVTQERITYHHAEGRFFFHPSMAKMRIKQLQLGWRDVTADALGLSPGGSVLDCTLGRAADACVAAHVVGAEGHVVGLEINPIIAALTRRGLREFDPQSPALAEAMARVEVVCADHEAFLRQADDGAFGVVYFDPFFGEALEGSDAINDLRAVGRHGPVSEESVAEALRVARRRVVFKVKRGEEPEAVRSWAVIGGRKSRIEYRVLELNADHA